MEAVNVFIREMLKNVPLNPTVLNNFIVWVKMPFCVTVRTPTGCRFCLLLSPHESKLSECRY